MTYSCMCGFASPDEVAARVHADECGRFRRQVMSVDAVNNPEHYMSHPSGVACIQVTEHMSFCLGNVIKYVWRADLKGGTQDLEKAQWYLSREIERRKQGAR